MPQTPANIHSRDVKKNPVKRSLLAQSVISEEQKENTSYALIGGIIGFLFYWLGFTIPFLVYGLSIHLLLLYTWPFFMALIPLSVFIGAGINILFSGRILISVPLCGILVVALYWQMFTAVSGVN